MSVVLLNDVHSQLNPCLVHHLANPESPDEAAHLISTRYATEQQLRTCYPEFDAWLKEKQQFDPGTKFWSDWLGHAKSYGVRVGIDT